MTVRFEKVPRETLTPLRAAPEGKIPAMNTAEFILALFNADPSGEAEVVVAPMLFGLPGDADWVRPEPGMVCNQGDRCTHVSLTIPGSKAIMAGLASLKAERDALATYLEGKLGIAPEIAPDEAVKGLADVVAASAREPHGDVVLHSLHVAGGAAAVASLSERDRPTMYSGEPWIAWRGSASDFVSDMRSVIPADKLAEVRALLRDSRPAYEGVIDEAERVDKRIEEPKHDSIGPRVSSYDGAHAPRSKTPANVAAFVLKAPAVDRLLLVRSKKEGRAWELPGGAVEPGEYPWVALVREVTEESGADLLDLERTTVPLDGCEVFRGTSETEQLTPGGDTDEARWVTRTEASLLTLSDLPSTRVIREWLDK